MNWNAIDRRIRRHRIACLLVLTATCIGSLLFADELTSPSNKPWISRHMSASQKISAESVSAADNSKHPYPAETSSVSTSSAPEPASLMLMLPAAFLLARRPRKA